MSRKKIKIPGFRTIYEHSVVSFISNITNRIRRGTVVYIYDNLKAMEVEINGAISTVKPNQIKWV